MNTILYSLYIICYIIYNVYDRKNINYKFCIYLNDSPSM